LEVAIESTTGCRWRIGKSAEGYPRNNRVKVDAAGAEM
jgi:hypothetical protein